jgi:hypothetical protein
MGSVLVLAALALVAGSSAAAAAGSVPDAAVPVAVQKHPTCNNDPGFDPSNEPLCRYQHEPYRDFRRWSHTHDCGPYDESATESRLAARVG